MSRPFLASSTRKDDASAIAANVPFITRAEFLDGWNYVPSHVTFLGPTQRGKTTFAKQLLACSISPELRCVILAGKPPGRDDSMATAANELNLRVVQTWPPAKSIRDRNKNGYVLKPKQEMKDRDADEKNVQIQYKKALTSLYASKKPVIVVADEAHHVQNDLKLKKNCEDILMRGMPVVSMWSLVQRGMYMSYHTYCEPEHIFIFADPDESNQDRYKQLGGVDPVLVKRIVANLKTYELPTYRTKEGTKGGNSISECLYIRRSGPKLMVIGVE